MCVQIFPPFSKTIFVFLANIVLLSVFYFTVLWMITVVPNVFRMYLTVGRGSPCTMQVKWASLPNPEWTFSASTSISGSSEIWKINKIYYLTYIYIFERKRFTEHIYMPKLRKTKPWTLIQHLLLYVADDLLLKILEHNWLKSPKKCNSHCLLSCERGNPAWTEAGKLKIYSANVILNFPQSKYFLVIFISTFFQF